MTHDPMRAETDVLVIGSGAAGMYAAIEAARSGCQVLLADRSLIGRGGATVMAQMTVAVALGSARPLESSLQRYTRRRAWIMQRAACAAVVRGRARVHPWTIGAWAGRVKMGASHRRWRPATIARAAFMSTFSTPGRRCRRRCELCGQVIIACLCAGMLVKIDGSFVRDMLTNSGSASIIKSVIGLSKDLSINVVAEGIETALKYARCATGRPGIIHCAKAFHGLLDLRWHRTFEAFSTLAGALAARRSARLPGCVVATRAAPRKPPGRGDAGKVRNGRPWSRNARP